MRRVTSAQIAIPIAFAVCLGTGAIAESQEDAYEAAQRAFDAELSACFDAAEMPEDCVNVVFASCEADGPTSLYNNYVIGCFFAEASAWEALMTAEYDRLRAEALSNDAYYAETQPEWAGAVEALATAQEAWDRYRLAECDFTSAQFGPGAERAIQAAICDRDRMAERAIALRGHLEPWGAVK